jgi:dihydroxy-acid dehydratase
MIHSDIANRTLTLELSEEEIAARLRNFTPPPLRWPNGVFRKYVDRVTSASDGATT